MTKCELYPRHRDELRERFGSLFFECVLMNLDVIGIRIERSYEVVVITYSGGHKVGFIYDCGNLTEEQVFAVYKDAPSDKNDLEKWEMKRRGKVTVLVPPKHNYVFISDKVVTTRQILNEIKREDQKNKV